MGAGGILKNGMINLGDSISNSISNSPLFSKMPIIGSLLGNKNGVGIGSRINERFTNSMMTSRLVAVGTPNRPQWIETVPVNGFNAIPVYIAGSYGGNDPGTGGDGNDPGPEEGPTNPRVDPSQALVPYGSNNRFGLPGGKTQKRGWKDRVKSAWNKVKGWNPFRHNQTSGLSTRVRRPNGFLNRLRNRFSGFGGMLGSLRSKVGGLFNRFRRNGAPDYSYAGPAEVGELGPEWYAPGGVLTGDIYDGVPVGLQGREIIDIDPVDVVVPNYALPMAGFADGYNWKDVMASGKSLLDKSINRITSSASMPKQSPIANLWQMVNNRKKAISEERNLIKRKMEHVPSSIGNFTDVAYEDLGSTGLSTNVHKSLFGGMLSGVKSGTASIKVKAGQLKNKSIGAYKRAYSRINNLISRSKDPKAAMDKLMIGAHSEEEIQAVKDVQQLDSGSSLMAITQPQEKKKGLLQTLMDAFTKEGGGLKGLAAIGSSLFGGILGPLSSLLKFGGTVLGNVGSAAIGTASVGTTLLTGGIGTIKAAATGDYGHAAVYGARTIMSSGSKILSAFSSVLTKFLQSKTVVNAMAKVGASGGSISKIATKAFAKAGSAAAGAGSAAKLLSKGLWPTIIATAVIDFGTGMYNANEHFNVQRSEITDGMRLASGLAKAISGLAFGLIPVDWLAQTFWKLFASTEEKEKLSSDQAKYQGIVDTYNQANGTNYSVEEFQKKFKETKDGQFKEKLMPKVWSSVGKALKGVGTFGWDAVSGTIRGIANLTKYTVTGDVKGLLTYKVADFKDEKKNRNNFAAPILNTAANIAKFGLLLPTVGAWLGKKVLGGVFGTVKNVFEDIGGVIGTGWNYVKFAAKGDMEGLLNYDPAAALPEDNMLSTPLKLVSFGAKLLTFIPTGVSWVIHKAVGGIVDIVDKFKNGHEAFESAADAMDDMAKSGDLMGLWNYQYQSGDEDGGLSGIWSMLASIHKVGAIVPAALNYAKSKLQDIPGLGWIKTDAQKEAGKGYDKNGQLKKGYVIDEDTGEARKMTRAEKKAAKKEAKQAKNYEVQQKGGVAGFFNKLWNGKVEAPAESGTGRRTRYGHGWGRGVENTDYASLLGKTGLFGAMMTSGMSDEHRASFNMRAGKIVGGATKLAQMHPMYIIGKALAERLMGQMQAENKSKTPGTSLISVIGQGFGNIFLKDMKKTEGSKATISQSVAQGTAIATLSAEDSMASASGSDGSTTSSGGFFRRAATTVKGWWNKLWGKGPIKFYSQTDHRWGNMAEDGCGPTAAAMVASAYGRGPSNPAEANAMSYQMGMRDIDGGTNPAFFSQYASQHGFRMQAGPVSGRAMAAAAESGHPVTVMGKGGVFGGGEHYMVLEGAYGRGKTAVLRDPLSGGRKTVPMNSLVNTTDTAIYSRPSGRGWGHGPEAKYYAAHSEFSESEAKEQLDRASGKSSGQTDKLFFKEAIKDAQRNRGKKKYGRGNADVEGGVSKETWVALHKDEYESTDDAARAYENLYGANRAEYTALRTATSTTPNAMVGDSRYAANNNVTKEAVLGLLNDYRVTGNYATYRSDYGGRYHAGVDMVPLSNSSEGAPIKSFTEGTVEKIGTNGDARGYYVMIKDPNGYHHIYQHLSGVPSLQVGDAVHIGDVVGGFGGSGSGQLHKYGLHLHYEVRSPSNTSLPGGILYTQDNLNTLTRDPRAYVQGYANGDLSNAMVSSGNSADKVREGQQALVNKMLWLRDNPIPYNRNGPNDPDKGSASCASTVGWAYRKVFGVTGMSDSSADQSKDDRFQDVVRLGQPGTAPGVDFDLNKLQPGDIVYMKNPKSNHTEMYIGNGMDISHGGGNWNYPGTYPGAEKGAQPGPTEVALDANRRKKVFAVRRYKPFITGDVGAINGDTSGAYGSSDGSSDGNGGFLETLMQMLTNFGTVIFGGKVDSNTNSSGGISSSGGSYGTATNVALEGNDTKEKIWRFLRKDLGLNAIAAAGVMGNFEQESGNEPHKMEADYTGAFKKIGFEKMASDADVRDKWVKEYLWPIGYKNASWLNRNAYYGDDGHTYPGFGLAQWTGPRGYRLFQFAKANNLNWTDLATQLDYFANGEGEFKSRGLVDKMNAASSTDDAAYIFARDFEGNTTLAQKERKDSAKGYYDLYKDLDLNDPYSGAKAATAAARAASEAAGYNGSAGDFKRLEYGKGRGNTRTIFGTGRINFGRGNRRTYYGAAPVGWGHGPSVDLGSNVRNITSQIASVNNAISKFRQDQQTASNVETMAHAITDAVQTSASNGNSEALLQTISTTLGAMLELMVKMSDKMDSKTEDRVPTTQEINRAHAYQPTQPARYANGDTQAEDYGAAIVRRLTAAT